MPIFIAPVNKELKVVKINADDSIRKHLQNLGIALNSEIIVLYSSGGSVVCRVKDGRVAIDKNLATKIMVA